MKAKTNIIIKRVKNMKGKVLEMSLSVQKH